jgi:hypothetical protein
VGVLMAGKKNYTGAGQGSSHPFTKEGGRGRGVYFEGGVREPAFISGGFVAASLLAAGTATHRYAKHTHIYILYIHIATKTSAICDQYVLLNKI